MRIGTENQANADCASALSDHYKTNGSDKWIAANAASQKRQKE
jgi:hypothetical protein